MVSLVSELSDALYVEETNLIDALYVIIKQLNTVYLDPDLRDGLTVLLQKLLDDTIGHSSALAKLLVEVKGGG